MCLTWTFCLLNIHISPTNIKWTYIHLSWDLLLSCSYRPSCHKMKENHTQLYPNEQVAQNVGAYSYQHSSQLPHHLLEYHKWVVENQSLATMMVSPLQAQFLAWIANAFKIKRGKFLISDFIFLLLLLELKLLTDFSLGDRVFCRILEPHMVSCHWRARSNNHD